MSKREAKAIYLTMKESGDLTDLLPTATGVWLEDKTDFIKLYQNNLHMLSDTSLDIETYDFLSDDNYDEY